MGDAGIRGEYPGSRSGHWLAPSGAPDRAAPSARTLGLGLLFLAGLGLGFLGILGGPPAPAEVRFEVVGDALIASFRDQGQTGVQLRLGETLLSPPLEVREGRRRLVHRGLPPERELEARLVLGGRETAPQKVAAAGPAIAGLVGLAADRSLVVEVARPCTARWQGASTTRFELSRGRQTLALPADPGDSLVLEWEEQGLPFQVRWSLEEVLAASLVRLRERLGGTDWVEVLRQRAGASDPRGEGFAEERRSFLPLLPWLGRLFASRLDPEQKRWLLAALQHWQRSVAAERALGDDPEDHLEVPPGEPGYHGPRLPPWKPDGELPIVPVPKDGAAPVHETGLIFMIPHYARDAPAYGAKGYDYATRLEFAWPPGLPPRGTGCLTLDADRLMPTLMLQIEAAAGTEGGLVLEFWVTDAEKLRTQSRYKGPATACFPLELAPPAGTPMKVTAPPFLLPAGQFQTLQASGHALRRRGAE
jgi:hypothetical protein